MPFKSIAQKNHFQKLLETGKISKADYDKMESGTPHHNLLPERVNLYPKVPKVRVIK